MAGTLRKLPNQTDPRYVREVGNNLLNAAMAVYLQRNMGYKIPTIRVGLTDEQKAERKRCEDFLYFLRYWKFINRETGKVGSFENLWPGQREAAQFMVENAWAFFLKAGKLGFTELECAWDAHVAIYGQPNARVHLFSKGQPESRNLLKMVKFGIEHLPPHLSRKIMIDAAGGDTLNTLMLAGDGPDDTRVIWSYAATDNAAIDQNATHTHLDELSHIKGQESLWGSVSTTVADASEENEAATIHIVTRGAGEVYTAELWRNAKAETGKLRGFFAPYTARPGRDEEWRKREAGTMHLASLRHFAPITEEDALAGDKDTEYVPIESWDMCLDSELPELKPGDRTPLVLGVDAGVSSDFFAVSGVSRHPKYHQHAAHRLLRQFAPVAGFIDYGDVKKYIRQVCKDFNVVCMTYDPYQMEDIAQEFTRESVVWCDKFGQQGERLVADAGLHRAIISREFFHSGNSDLRMAVMEAGVEINEKSDSKMRIVKRKASSKIDTLVATSMARERCLELNI